jgi:hypothetical protein
VRTHDVADALRAADRVVDRRHAERLANAMNPSMSSGGASPWFTQSETLHRRPSMGMMIPQRLLPRGVGWQSTPSQSVGASSGVSPRPMKMGTIASPWRYELSEPAR